MPYQEEQDVFLRLFWKLWRFTWPLITFLCHLFRLFLQSPQIIVLTRYLGELLFFFPGRFIAMQQQVIVYVLLDRESGIQEALDFVFPMLELVIGNALGVNADFVDHTARGVPEVGIVLEKVGMTEDVRSDKGILQEFIHLNQKVI